VPRTRIKAGSLLKPEGGISAMRPTSSPRTTLTRWELFLGPKSINPLWARLFDGPKSNNPLWARLFDGPKSINPLWARLFNGPKSINPLWARLFDGPKSINRLWGRLFVVFGEGGDFRG
jgi:hypothetical protein